MAVIPTTTTATTRNPSLGRHVRVNVFVSILSLSSLIVGTTSGLVVVVVPPDTARRCTTGGGGGGGFGRRRVSCSNIICRSNSNVNDDSSSTSRSTSMASTTTSATTVRNAFLSKIEGKLILAPLTKGGNYPFRKLCSDMFGLQVSFSEMVFARHLLKGDRIEANRMRRVVPTADHDDRDDGVFGVQIATNNVEEGVGAVRRAKEAGADFVDLNCGCPIEEATRRGLGSSLLRSPKKLGALVAGIVKEAPELPLSVKIRLSAGGVDSINVDDVVRSVEEAGAAAVTIHARTARQRYRAPADWSRIQKVVSDQALAGTGLPIIGNGDILTQKEARMRMDESGVAAAMTGRGALIKPWIFQEFNEGKDWDISLNERIEVYYALTKYMKDYFGDDDLGRGKTWKFLPWHFSFFSRYMPYPEDNQTEEGTPFMHRRIDHPKDVSPLYTLLSHRSEDAHDLISDSLWQSDSSTDAVQRLVHLAESREFQNLQNNELSEQRYLDDRDREQDGNCVSTAADATELSNIPSSSSIGGKRGRNPRRRRRSQAPDRTPEEIAQIRAERAAKKMARLALAAEAEAAGLSSASGQSTASS
mmetsp:Transcript_31148/g.75294  ORF Transcript_31148/g.75294 Transcript_31148/m.75294 type:complete len:588 (-) Transcript_31148:404-2167(-)